MKRTETFIFAGGGTGGHLYPAVALAEKIKSAKPGCHIHFVGTARGIESRVVPELGYPLHRIVVRGFARQLTLKNLLAPFALVWSVLQCILLFVKIRPTAVIGTGGYVSGPVLFVAGLLRTPSVIQEQNSYPGVTTRMLAKVVDRVHLSFEESKQFFKCSQKLVVTGNPVREFDLAKDKKKIRKKLNLDTDAPTLLITGGSQGAHAINVVVMECLHQLLEETPLQVIWSTGRADLQIVQNKAAPFQDRVKVFEFITNMEDVMIAADLILARAGALTLAEITLCGLPAILVPYPFAAANHQERNARALQQVGAAVVLLQHELTNDVLLNTLKDLLRHPAKMTQMSRAAKQAAFPNAAADIVQSIFELIESRQAGVRHES